MFNRVYDFSNLDLFSCQDLDFPNNTSPDFNKPVVQTALPQAEAEMNNDFFYQKSTQDIACCYEISFEESFMKEHEAVFKKALQKIMEFLGISHQQPNIQLEDYLNGMEEQQAFTLRKQLQDYDKLSGFLNIVVKQAPQPLAKLLISLALTVVEKYDDIKFTEPNQEDLLELAMGVARTLHLEKLMSVNGINVSGKNFVEKGKQFLEVYCATVIVVAAQYFANPYTDDSNGFKRPLVWSDDSEEDSIESTPSKKRKFSF